MTRKLIPMLVLTLVPRMLLAQELDLTALEGQDWYGLYFNGQKAGWAVSELRVRPGGGAVTSMTAKFRLLQMGVPQELENVETRVYGPDGALESIEARNETAMGVSTFRGRVADGEFVLVSEVGGNESEQRLPVPRENLRDALHQVRVLQDRPSVGDSVTFSRFEPMFARELEGTSTLTGSEDRVLNGVQTQVYSVRTELSFPGMELTSDAVVAPDGTVLEDTLSGILKLRREPEEVAKAGDFSNDVIVSNAATADRPIANPRSRDRVVLALEGPIAGAHLLDDRRQTFTKTGDGALFVGTPASVEGLPTVTRPVTEKSVAEWLEPTAFIQSGHPKLVEKANAVAGDETDAWAAAKKLSAWVSDNVKTSYTASLSNALEVLGTMEGDCTEHSVLFVGLARAAGIPAREVAGLVYVEGDKPAFYFHQWAKVWVGGWVDVDPTFNQPLADATHIKLAEGDLIEQVKLMPLIGQLRVRVLDDVPAPAE